MNMNMDKVIAIIMVTTINLFTRKKKVTMMNTIMEVMTTNKIRGQILKSNRGDRTPFFVPIFK